MIDAFKIVILWALFPNVVLPLRVVLLLSGFLPTVDGVIITIIITQSPRVGVKKHCRLGEIKIVESRTLKNSQRPPFASEASKVFDDILQIMRNTQHLFEGFDL